MPVVLLTLQIAGVLTREDVAVAKSMSAMYLAISGVTDLRDITITRKARPRQRSTARFGAAITHSRKLHAVLL